MIGVGILRCFFLASIMVWYSASVWQTVDKYFRDQFRVYLEKEYESNAEIKKDVMMEAERIAAKKAMIERIAKLQFSKSLDEYEEMSRFSDEASRGGERIAEGVAEVAEGTWAPVEDGGETVLTGGKDGTGGTQGTLEEEREELDEECRETAVDEAPSNENVERNCEFSEEDEERKVKEYEENGEHEGGFMKWRGTFADDDEICHFEDLAVSVSVSAWTLVAISVERYFAICHPLRSRRWQTLSHAYKLITLIWFGSLAAMAPVAALSELQPTSQGHHKCRENWPSLNFERAYNVLLDVVLLVLPLAILTATYSMITMTLRRGMRLERAQRKRARKGSRRGSRRSKKWRGRLKGEGSSGRGGGGGGTEGTSPRNIEGIVGGGGGGGVAEVYLERNGSTATRCCRNRADDSEPRDRWHLRRGRYGGAASAEDDESDDTEPEEDEGELRRSDAERSLRSKRRVIRMLFVLVLEFFVCWTPLHALNTAASFFGAHAVYSGIGGYPTVAACHLLAYCSSCCNPITYGFMNARFRQAFLGAFGCQRKKSKGQIDLERLRASRSMKVPSSGKVNMRSPAFALAYSRGGESAALRGASVAEDCSDSLSEFLPPLLESKCLEESRECLKGVHVENKR